MRLTLSNASAWVPSYMYAGAVTRWLDSSTTTPSIRVSTCSQPSSVIWDAVPAYGHDCESAVSEDPTVSLQPGIVFASSTGAMQQAPMGFPAWWKPVTMAATSGSTSQPVPSVAQELRFLAAPKPPLLVGWTNGGGEGGGNLVRPAGTSGCTHGEHQRVKISHVKLAQRLHGAPGNTGTLDEHVSGLGMLRARGVVHGVHLWFARGEAIDGSSEALERDQGCHGFRHLGSIVDTRAGQHDGDALPTAA